LNINELIAIEYANVRLQLKQIGRPIPENDIRIAAICKVNDIPLITRDKHLTYVEDLEVITV
jgi:tRNA(fMet)-specific endonuclease VapC